MTQRSRMWYEKIFLLPVQSHNHQHLDCPPCFRGKTTQKVLQLELSWGLLDWSWPFEEKDRDALSCDSKVDIGVVAECCDADSRQQEEEKPLVLQAESERIQGPTANVGLCTYNCFYAWDAAQQGLHWFWVNLSSNENLLYLGKSVTDLSRFSIIRESGVYIETCNHYNMLRLQFSFTCCYRYHPEMWVYQTPRVLSWMSS